MRLNQEIVQQYYLEQQLTPSQIAKKLKVAYKTVWGYLNRHGLLRQNDIRPSTRTRNLLGLPPFGNLSVIEYAGSQKNRAIWKCLCSCGAECFVNGSDLTTLKARHCGCKAQCRSRGKDSINWSGYEEISGVIWNRIQESASSRRLEFDITQEYVWGLYIKQDKQCALSGLPIRFSTYYKDKTKTTASLDRIDSTQGYVKDNVQWLHKDVNKLKNNFSDARLIELCRSITIHQDSIQDAINKTAN